MARVSIARIMFCLAAAALVLTLSPAARASISLDELGTLIDSARTVEAPVYAPETFKEALNKYEDAQMQAERGKKQSEIDKYVDESQEYVESALKTTEVAKLTLADYIPPRTRARDARAPELVPELYQEAEEQFIKATKKVEDGDVQDGLKEAEKAVALYDTAELQAIRRDVLGQADHLLAEALEDEAEKYAPVTLDKARSARNRADSILVYDRYDRSGAAPHVTRAEYEARHASNIAQTVRSLERNDQAWEKLMLVYEIEMNKIGAEFGWDHLPFDRGPSAAADSVKTAINRLQSENEALHETNRTVAQTLTTTIERLGAAPEVDDVSALSVELDGRVAEMLAQNRELAQTVAAEKARLSQLSEQHEQVS
ncbi:hypothetical protein GF420_12295, partial [candidate division GN15 bacterium]|nr:hypothetical protein [candidate division GN15 bacterium]